MRSCAVQIPLAFCEFDKSRITQMMSSMDIEIDPYTMTSGDVARVLGVTDERVRQLDDELKPRRRPNGRRYYLPSRVVEVARARARVRGIE